MPDLENFQKVERTTLTMEEVAEYLGISYWLVGQLDFLLVSGTASEKK